MSDERVPTMTVALVHICIINVSSIVVERGGPRVLLRCVLLEWVLPLLLHLVAQRVRLRTLCGSSPDFQYMPSGSDVTIGLSHTGHSEAEARTLSQQLARYALTAINGG